MKKGIEPSTNNSIGEPSAVISVLVKKKKKLFRKTEAKNSKVVNGLLEKKVRRAPADQEGVFRQDLQKKPEQASVICDETYNDFQNVGAKDSGENCYYYQIDETPSTFQV